MMMPRPDQHPEVPVSKLRWRCDPASLPFASTQELSPLTEIIGQDRGVQAFQYALSTNKTGYNVIVTGPPHSGRLAFVEKILRDHAQGTGAPDDLAYVNNFKDPDAPVLLRFPAGQGQEFRQAVHGFVDELKREAPQLFESEEYLARKKEIADSSERRVRDFFKDLDRRVKDEGFALLINVPGGPMQIPELTPMIDGEPVPMPRLEDMAEKGRFPQAEFDSIKHRYDELKRDIDHILLQVRDVHRELNRKSDEVDRHIFRTAAERLAGPLLERYQGQQYEKVRRFLEDMFSDMLENLDAFRTGGKQQVPGLPGLIVQMGDPFGGYQVNLIVDNAEQKGPPVIIESYPTYRNMFGSIERVVDRAGVWRTDFSKIRVGSFVRASGGFLVVYLWDALREPGVWPALVRALKTKRMEIQSYDPFSFFSSTGVKPEPVEVETKVVVIGDAFLYHLLRTYDEDLAKVFRVRADLDSSMDRSERAVEDLARFIKKTCEEEGLRPFDRTGIAAVVEESVRLTGRKEKVSTVFPSVAEIIREADYWAGFEGAAVVAAEQVLRAVESRRFRSNLVEQKLQEMIDRDSLMIDTAGSAVGQVNGLAIFSLGDLAFGRPTRITATTAMGREGVIDIEREASMSGPIHSKGVYILSGYLRRLFAQNKPLTMSASVAFEQSYSEVEGDSASSTEIYAILSSLSGVPIIQSIAVTGSVNQNGEVQAIGGVNEKVEGFYDTCVQKGLTGSQGVLIPEANVQDLMLRDDVIDAIEQGRFHLWSVRTIGEGLEILTGRSAGVRGQDGLFPADSVLGLADARLKEMAETMRGWQSSLGDRHDDQAGDPATPSIHRCPSCGRRL